MSERRFHALLGALAAASPPGSRVCFRNLAAIRSLPPATDRGLDRPRWSPLPELEDALYRDDASVFYRFGVAQIR